jgi:hypothetical protein
MLKEMLSTGLLCNHFTQHDRWCRVDIGCFTKLDSVLSDLAMSLDILRQAREALRDASLESALSDLQIKAIERADM